MKAKKSLILNLIYELCGSSICCFWSFFKLILFCFQNSIIHLPFGAFSCQQHHVSKARNAGFLFPNIQRELKLNFWKTESFDINCWAINWFMWSTQIILSIAFHSTFLSKLFSIIIVFNQSANAFFMKNGFQS